ncbi:ABC transporter substrate-binding protein [Streptomyces sp. NBC_00237]|uniref:ABC transporter substrate-binding protein n=1 Tax=Streptomyces sp. NBC_00237 TaxID=2975687 RepID=UPI00225BA642|nr:ABC transporter substrate-binding protein [Streptomyces sp. NBC_00237]MCX5202161.1 ABC transporter substrate-binding protein [Streptomyces sp. NBC_00237]
MQRPRAAERPLYAALTALLVLCAAACGSRLPESDFERPTAGAPTDAPPLRVGILVSATSPIGGDAFTGPGDGARAYFDVLNTRGGIGGRRVQVETCDDGGSGIGNTACVHELLDEKKVFALVATTALDYAGASLVSAAGAPDIGGQPLGNAYETYPHLYGIYGSLAPRKGGKPGWDGTLYGGTETYRYFKREHGASTAAVVSYNQASSAAYARLTAQGLREEGYTVVEEQVDFALPNFRAVAADLKERGADLVLDALDTHGNAQLCKAMDAVGASVTAKVTNVQNWSSTVPADYADAPRCRNALWVTGGSRNYDDKDDPQVREFRTALQNSLTRNGRNPDALSQWQLEGWAAAMWFTDAASSCPSGALTRACVERYLDREEPYTARGLLLPVRYAPTTVPPAERHTCVSVARWRDGTGWVTQRDMSRNCFTVPQLPYKP